MEPTVVVEGTPTLGTYEDNRNGEISLEKMQRRGCPVRLQKQLDGNGRVIKDRSTGILE